MSATTNSLRERFLNDMGAVFDSYVTQLFSAVSENTNKPVAELNAMWGNLSTQASAAKKKTSSGTTRTRTSTADRPQCSHTIQRGTNKGKKCAGKAKEGSDHCSKHGAKAASSTSTASTGVPKTVDAKGGDDESESEEQPLVVQTTKGSFTVENTKHGYVHRTSGFLLDKNRKLVGRLNGSKVEPLVAADRERNKTEFAFDVAAEDAPKVAATTSTKKKSSKKESDDEDSSDADSD